ncbi:DUF1365 domain-containing protein [Thorsellia anophelis]|uniref:DUF1365 domain-containing protein n=1 Tax=Thorsellia anophelis DSM 18579 TaxID=1123402 RepID=A0A1H9YRK0_9GAMM|nr:DUF1365 domain-containing protein [Thorsellia anophelis]SES71137.1 hypothetical protein SAMN02583745_00294 [Thorsellia anophelis DSM 18579]
MHTQLPKHSIKQALILKANVMHKRLIPKVNAFNYEVYYLSLPLELLESQNKTQLGNLALNRFSLHSFYFKDHGYRDDRSLRQWANDILTKYSQPIWHDITLICMPRVLGYVFNPVSFWVCRDNDQAIKAVICEVNNTFGETHTYLCLPPSSTHSLSPEEPLNSDAKISPQNWLIADKCFHVSPFLPRQGEYHFRFDIQEISTYINIDYYQDKNTKTLITSLKGTFLPLTRKQRLIAFITCPLVTLKAIGLIHYQAIKILIKKIPFIKLPKQLSTHDSKTRNK